MIKVQRHGAKFTVRNPINQAVNTMVNVVFVEDGRSGGDEKMSGSSDFLSGILGQEVGLNNLRTHTQPIQEDKLHLFPVGASFPGHINRGIYSTPQLRQQIGVPPRMVDGQPSYFKTWFDNTPKEDEDKRISLDVYAQIRPGQLFDAQIGAAEVVRIEGEPNQGQLGAGQNQGGQVGSNVSQNQNFAANAGQETLAQ